MGIQRMRIEVEQITGAKYAREACSFTSAKESNIRMETLAQCEHSPLRTQMFMVRMFDIPTFVSVHLVRHKIGVEHYVKSNRTDHHTHADEEITRLTPVNHLMFLNAHSLIHMARKRLCFNASEETRAVMKQIKEDCPDWLSPYLVKECVYRRNFCPEVRPCTEMKAIRDSWGPNGSY